MIPSEFIEQMKPFNALYNEPLAPFTTWKIGGNAEVLVQVATSDELKAVLELVAIYDIPYRVLGKASNILISDNGLQGVVIINRSRHAQLPSSFSQKTLLESISNPEIPHRHSETGDTKFYSFADLEFTDTGAPIPITFNSSCELASVITVTTKHKLSGLQWFAGIPGTLGGSLYNNIHGGTKHFSDYFVSARLFIPSTSTLATEAGILEHSSVTVINSSSNWLEIEAGFDFFQFGYDESILRKHEEIIVLEVTLNFYQRTDDKALEVARQWLVRKKIQPKKSCGSVFQCITLQQQESLGFPTASAGYIIDKVLNFRGKKEGGVMIAENHANFIENVSPDAKAADVLTLIRAVRAEVKSKIGITLYPEINFLGFTSEELAGVVGEL